MVKIAKKRRLIKVGADNYEELNLMKRDLIINGLDPSKATFDKTIKELLKRRRRKEDGFLEDI